MVQQGMINRLTTLFGNNQNPGRTGIATDIEKAKINGRVTALKKHYLYESGQHRCV
jgi:hypothetical protein